MELSAYYKCLFNPNDSVCLSYTPRGTTVTPLLEVEDDLTAFTYISINAFFADKDTNPTEVWHCEKIPRRADHNVSTYRNILIEMDKFPLDKQLDYIKELGLPYSTCVYSGGKSYHFIISLSEPVLTRKEYNDLAIRVYKAIGMDYVDPTCKNPSRFSRAPGHIREETGKEQRLICVNGRVDKIILEGWLLSRGVGPIEESPWEDITRKSFKKKDFSSLSGATKNFFLVGKDLTTGWNIALFKAAADMCRNGWEEDEARAELLQITGTLDGTDEKTIRSAFNNERNKVI